MIVHVIFTPDGIPGWFGPEPVQGSAPLDQEELRHLLPADAPEDALASCWQSTLITHRRVDGTWMLRTAGATAAQSPGLAAMAEPEPTPNADPDAPEADVAV